MNKIEKIIQNGYKLESDLIYNDTFDIYKKMIVPAAAILFMLMVLFVGIYAAILFSFFDSMDDIQTFLDNLSFLDFNFEILLLFNLGNAAINGIMGVIGAGFIKMAYDVYHNKLPKFGTVFSFFIKIEGLKVFLFSAFLHLLYNVLSLGLDFVGLSMVGIFLYLLIHVLTLLVIPFIIFDKLPIHKAIFASINLVNQKPFNIMSYFILLGLLSLTGLFLFAIGIIFTAPIFYCFNFSIYQNIVNKN